MKKFFKFYKFSKKIVYNRKEETEDLSQMMPKGISGTCPR